MKDHLIIIGRYNLVIINMKAVKRVLINKDKLYVNTLFLDDTSRETEISKTELTRLENLTEKENQDNYGDTLRYLENEINYLKSQVKDLSNIIENERKQATLSYRPERIRNRRRFGGSR